MTPTRSRVRALFALLLLLAVALDAAGDAPAPPSAAIEPRPGALLPLASAFRDEDGRTVRLGDAFDGRRPVVLVPGYYRCPNLCGLTMHGVLETLAASGLGADVRVLRVSIDPDETPADARERATLDRAFAASLAPAAAAPLDLRALVGAPASIEALASSIGYRYAADAAGRASPDAARRASRWVHAAGFIVATPQGHVARGFDGVRFDARELRLALLDAAAGRTGGWGERLLLICAHFDPRGTGFDAAVLNGVRAVGLLLVLAIGGWIWRHRRTPADEAQRP